MSSEPMCGRFDTYTLPVPLSILITLGMVSPTSSARVTW